MNAIVSRLADIVGDAILTDVQVSGVTPVAPGFIRVTLHDQGFADKRWSPGDKLQLRPYRGSLSLRTYTPIAWDNANATTQLIGWATDHGPGGRWFGEVADRDTCSVFGPRRSVELGKTGDEVVFVGDASMSPYEITVPGGSVEHMNEEPGAAWLKRVTDIYEHAVWLNPVPPDHWDWTPSIKLVKDIMGGRMYPLTLDGLDKAMRELMR